MTTIDPTVYPIIGMSPGNSYFQDQAVEHLLKTLITRYGHTAVLVPDIPAISTYIALGYSENRARRDKAIPQGNRLKNRVKRAMDKLGYSSELVHIIDWENEIELNADYGRSYTSIQDLYQNNSMFEQAVDITTRSVLEASGRDIPNMEVATKQAAHYLLSEIAFFEFAPAFFGCKKVIDVYHKQWPVFEEYISGRFDGIVKPHLGFLLLLLGPATIFTARKSGDFAI